MTHFSLNIPPFRRPSCSLPFILHSFLPRRYVWAVRLTHSYIDILFRASQIWHTLVPCTMADTPLITIKGVQSGIEIARPPPKILIGM